jgi:capsular exopolysaccharide synthesis family protein
MARKPEFAKEADEETLSGIVSTMEHGKRSAPRAPTIEELSSIVPRIPVPVLQAVQTPGSVLGEELRLLRAKVRNFTQGRGLKCFAMISAGPGEGKSTLSLGLAGTVAQEPNRRVLLIEADLRKPALEGYLGLPRISGLSEWLAGDNSSVGVRCVGVRGFFLLSAGLVPLEQPELLGSERMEGLLLAARQTFDVIILDCPPLVPVADSIVLQDLVDGFLCVVRSRYTPRDVLKRALSNLRPEKILGLVLNNRREILATYQRNAYRQYGLKDS